MIQPVVNVQSIRSRKARLASLFGRHGATLFFSISLLLVGGGLYLLFITKASQLAYACFSIASIFLVIGCWYVLDVQNLPPVSHPQTLDDILDQAVLAKITRTMTPESLWRAIGNTTQANFVCNHLLLSSQTIAQSLSTDTADMAPVWQRAIELTGHQRHPVIHAGTLTAALLLTSVTLAPVLTQQKVTNDDILEVLHWLNRQLSYIHHPKPYYGGIGRDWANGFTPRLEQFGHNITAAVKTAGGAMPYTIHEDMLNGISSSIAQGNGVAVIGDHGSGKTSLVHGLAQRLIEGRDPYLPYYQVISLDASVIISYSGAQLERLLLTLFHEAVTAGNIILCLDDARLFFSNGTGAFDLSQVLMPLLKSRNCKLIATFTPGDWQALEAQNAGLASSFARFNLTEPSELATIRIAEDQSILLAYRAKTIISLDAIQEAYRLSGQYLPDQAYPGKVITLLEQALPYAHDHFVMAETVQQAIEKTRGIKVGQAQAPEAALLLHLEDLIHERMINQKRAVQVVAAALRRGRAGVTNPDRPVGSFLLLGPTGVGKTELARSLAATYYGSEQNMIRLDMSEYQQAGDVSRILSATGADRGLLSAVREQPFSVIILDEIEKAHPNILNLLLQMLDEGQLTDSQGRIASFRSSIIIATSNAGAADIISQIQSGQPLEDFERPLIDTLIARGQFKPELLNRFDEIVLFRPLTEDELMQVAEIMIGGINKTLEPQKLQVSLTPEALKAVVHAGYDPEFGARPMRRIMQKTVENAMAVKILAGDTKPGDTIVLDVTDIALEQ